jgi:hypothetical protein
MRPPVPATITSLVGHSPGWPLSVPEALRAVGPSATRRVDPTLDAGAAALDWLRQHANPG